MRKIIEGLLYDTETAEELFVLETSIFATLTFYKTPKGRYFTLLENRDLFSKHYSIRPSDEETVKHMICDEDADAYIRIFGAIEEA